MWYYWWLLTLPSTTHVNVVFIHFWTYLNMQTWRCHKADQKLHLQHCLSSYSAFWIWYLAKMFRVGHSYCRTIICSVNGTNFCSKMLFSSCWMCTKSVTHCQILIISVVSVCVSASPCLVCVWWPSIRPSTSWMSSLHPVSGATTTLSCLGITVMLITSHPMAWSMSTVF